MTTPLPFSAVVTLLFLSAFFPLPSSLALGGSSAATLAVAYGSATTICTITAQLPIHQIQCWSNGQLISPILPSTSFDAIAGGLDTICGFRSGGSSLLCWNNTFNPKRIYNNSSAPLNSLTVGETQICALRNVTDNSTGENVVCWRGNDVSSARSRTGNDNSLLFRMISSGLTFSCGVLESTNRVLCWGDDETLPLLIQRGFANYSMVNIQVGGQHACGIDNSGVLICRGNNDNGQSNVPSNSTNEYSPLIALGANHSCAIRRLNRTVDCWGANLDNNPNITVISFEFIVAGLNFTCGLTRSNFSVICWGSGWPNQYHASGIPLPFSSRTLPGPCVDSICECGLYPDSETLCSGSGHICSRSCDIPVSIPPISPPVVVIRSPSRSLRKGLLAFAILGSIGGFAAICSLFYWLWRGGCFGKKKIHNSVQPTITASNGANHSGSTPPSRSSTLRRQGSILMRRQRSGTSFKHTDRAEEFTFSDLVAATNNFSLEQKLGAGSFGVVYKGKLIDGREVAIKRSETGPRTKKFQEKESAFDSELAFLSRLHHKHLVRLVGYCEERDERLLVYEYMKNGALYDHLHDKNNVEKNSSFVNSWKVRIKISLDAARGIEYLHNYAVPPIIHRDIKSSNILLDVNWTARVSDFGLSLLGPEDDREYKPMKAAGTVGYIDPEYYSLNVLTAKSDVYGLGVVLLELLTGKRSIFKSGDKSGDPISVVEYAVPAIRAGELGGILDPRVGPPDVRESEAVELVGYTAMHCVHLEGKDRPTMADIVSNLDRALALCDESHGSISSGPMSIVSD